MATVTTVPAETFVDENGIVHVNDIRAVNGRLVMTSGKAAHANIIECAVRTRLGELPLDTEQGIPYFETVFQSSRLTPEFESALRSRIEELYFVEEVVDLSTEFDRDRSTVNYTATVRTVDGDVITLSNAIGNRPLVSDLIGAGGGSMEQLVKDGQFYLPVHKTNGVQYYRVLTDSYDPDNGVQPAISDELFRRNPTTGAFEEV